MWRVEYLTNLSEIIKLIKEDKLVGAGGENGDSHHYFVNSGENGDSHHYFVNSVV